MQAVGNAVRGRRGTARAAIPESPERLSLLGATSSCEIKLRFSRRTSVLMWDLDEVCLSREELYTVLINTEKGRSGSLIAVVEKERM